MDGHDRLLAAFLAGDLDPAEARRWDEHLLECERCWRAVREDRAGRQAAELLRQPAPAGLGDRVRLAVELAAAGTTSPPQRRLGGRLRWHGSSAPWRLPWAWRSLCWCCWFLAGGQACPPRWRRLPATRRRCRRQPGSRGRARVGRSRRVEVGLPITMTAGGQRGLGEGQRQYRLARLRRQVSASFAARVAESGTGATAGSGN